MTQGKLLSDSLQRIDAHLQLATKVLQELDNAILYRKPEAGKWAVAEVLVHVVQTFGLYYAKMDRILDRPTAGDAHLQKPYRKGFIGGIIIAMMENPKRKFPKFTAFQPKLTAADSELQLKQADTDVVQDYLEAVAVFRSKVERFGEYDLQKHRFPNPVSAIHRFQLGDAIWEHTVHLERHWQQIERTIARVQSTD